MAKQLWAPWRLEYIAQADEETGCVFCDEAAGRLGDESLAVARGERAFVLLNKYPYASGHLMVAPVRHVAELADHTGHASRSRARVATRCSGTTFTSASTGMKFVSPAQRGTR